MENPQNAYHFLLYYVVASIVILTFYFRRRPYRGMRLKLSGGAKKGSIAGRTDVDAASAVTGQSGADDTRSLNVVFNYNGHSWDAYEVLGLPAGSSTEKVDAAFRESMARVDAGSRPFMEAAYRAIKGSPKSLKASSH